MESTLASKSLAFGGTVAFFEEMAASIGRMNAGQGIDDIAYAAYRFDFFVDHVNDVLDQRNSRLRRAS